MDKIRALRQIAPGEDQEIGSNLVSLIKSRILIVEDVASLAENYAAYFRHENLKVDIAHTGREALQSLERDPAAVMVLDVNLPDMSGLDVLESVKRLGAPCEVVIITAESSVNLAVSAMRLGAFDFIMKPFTRDRLLVTVRNALQHRTLTNQLLDVNEEIGEGRIGKFIGRSLPMQAVYRIIRSAAPTNATVFITGESGTGKELCADALHNLSKRRNGPFIVVNCAAIPKDLLESEIFGHVKGAFTGAAADRKGAALQADGGTLFLDEIGEMDLTLQAKLLRFLQEKSVQRVGEDFTRRSDTRIVCATNRDPQMEVTAGRFREDLFYRLHVVPVELPPLRERDQDILLIAQHFLEKFSAEDEKSFKGFSSDAAVILQSYHWPGNIRQLQNTIRSIVVLYDGREVTPDMLPREITSSASVVRFAVQPQPSVQSIAAAALPANPDEFQIRPLEDVIRTTIENAIEQSGGSIPRAAAALKVSASTLYRRMQGWQESEAAARAAPFN